MTNPLDMPVMGDDDREAFALQAAITAYRLVCAAQVALRQRAEMLQAAHDQAIAKQIEEWRIENEQRQQRINARRAARSARDPLLDLLRPTEQTPDDDPSHDDSLDDPDFPDYSLFGPGFNPDDPF